MKLLSCYIENYGNVSKKKIEFKEGITEFYEKNGYGKSTLASFLKAMFYGLDGYRTDTKEFSERQHFYPFSGGNFGGNAVFEHEGKTYKVERFFGEKSTVSDEVTVFIDGTQVFGYDDIGEKIFGVDKQSFERTVFICDDDVEISATSDIKGKIGEILDGGANADEAMKLLTEAASRYKKSKKANDLVTAEKERAEKLRLEITNAEKIRETLSEKYSDLKTLKERTKETEEKFKEAGSKNEEFAVWDNYERLFRQAKKSEDELNTLLVGFSGGIPEEKEIDEAEKKLSEGSIVAATINSLKSVRYGEKNLRLKERFEGRIPTLEDREKLDDLIKDYKEAKSAFDGEAEFIEVKQESKKKNGKAALTAAISAAALIVGGILFAFNLLAAIIALSVGVIGIFASGFIYLNAKTDAAINGGAVTAINPEKQNKKQTAEKIRAKIEEYLLSYGCSGNDVLGEAQLFKSALQDYLELLKEEDARKEEIVGEENRLSEIKKYLDGFADKYALSGKDYAEVIRLARKRVAEVRYAERRLEEQKAAAAKFKDEKGLKEKPTGEKADVGELQAEISELYGRISRAEKEISDAEREVERLDELYAQKDEADAKIKEYTEKHELLLKAKKYIETAEKNLVEEYVKPIKDSFISYGSEMASALGSQVSMNKNFEITYEEGGKERSERYKSKGKRSVIATCYRLALIDNMYREAKPFIILDDPFTGLDEEHLQKAKILLKELSAKVQMIYFTCHESRRLA